MNDDGRGEVTELLSLWSSGDRAAERRLFEILYTDLRRRARAILRNEVDLLSLGATGLVHEAYLRFERMGQLKAQDRSEFLLFASHVMREIVVDRARRRRAAKRGGGARPVEIDDSAIAGQADRTDEILLVDNALRSLKVLSPRQEQIVEMRFFSGYTIEETAVLLGISSRTVRRLFETARTKLKIAIEGDVGTTLAAL